MTIKLLTMSTANNIINNIKSLVAPLKLGSNSDLVRHNVIASLNSMPSILSKDFEMDGEINNSGVLEIEGRVRGTIRGNSVVIREGGVVEGKIEVDSINIRGLFKGEMRARNVNIFKKAKILGNIEYASLSVEDGACIDGQFRQLPDKKGHNKH